MCDNKEYIPRILWLRALENNNNFSMFDIIIYGELLNNQEAW